MKSARVAAIVGLLFLGITSVIGAIPMLLHPAGEPWQMPQSLLKQSPFHSFLIPGIVLLLANGVLSFMVLGMVLRRRRGCGNWVALQGCILCGWIGVEVAMLRVAVWPHYFYAAIGLMLVAAGLALRGGSRPA